MFASHSASTARPSRPTALVGRGAPGPSAVAAGRHVGEGDAPERRDVRGELGVDVSQRGESSTARAYSPRCQSATRRSTLASTGPLVLPAARPSISASSASRSAASTSPTVRAAWPRHSGTYQRVERIADGLGPPGERADLGLARRRRRPARAGRRIAAAGRGARAAPSAAASAMAMISEASAIASATCVGPAMASQWAARHGRGRAAPRLPGRAPRPPRRARGGASSGAGERQRHRQPSQHRRPAGEHRRVGEGTAGLLEEIDLTLVEQPNLEAGEVGAEPERSAARSSAEPLDRPSSASGRERPPGAGLVAGEEQRPPESGEGIGLGYRRSVARRTTPARSARRPPPTPSPPAPGRRPGPTIGRRPRRRRRPRAGAPR